MNNQLKQERIAKLRLSGADISVGVTHDDSFSSPWLKTEMDQPTYMSEAETRLLIAALAVAVDECGPKIGR